MNWRVSIRPAAKTDLTDARDWYDRQRLGLGDEFFVSIAEALARLEEAPERFPIYHADFRRVLVERFPYKIFFRIEDHAVIVFRILHSASEHAWRLR